MGPIKSFIAIFSLALTQFFTFHSSAQSGTLDPSFDTDGKIVIDLGTDEDYGVDVAIQPDGKIVVVGSTLFNWAYQLYVMRLNPDGSYDNSFSADGMAYASNALGDSEGNSVVIQEDGKIVVGGNINSHFAVFRFNSDGSLDNTYGTNGVATTTFGSSYDNINCISLQADGKIVASGTKIVNTTNNQFVTARFNTDGTLDTTFSGDGKVSTQIGTLHDDCIGNAIQPDGKIVLIGGTEAASTRNLALVRYNSDGTLDTSFDVNGIVITPIGAESLGIGITVQPDGKIVGTGLTYAVMGGDSDVFTIRYNSDGTLDNTFDTDGMVITSIGSGDDRGIDILVQPNGKIITCGFSSFTANGDFLLICYNNDGTLDNSFSGDGIALEPMGLDMDGAVGMALQADGKLVVTGYATNNGVYDIAVARFFSMMDASVNEIVGIENGMSVYPNPLNDKATITLDGAMKNAVLTITDSYGQVVKTIEDINGQYVVIGREELNSGVYYVTLREESQLLGTQKLVIVD